MKSTFGWSHCLVVLLSAVLLSISAQAQTPDESVQALPQTSQIVTHLIEKNSNRAEMLHRYTGCRYYSLDYHGLLGHKQATMLVHVSYAAPDEKQFQIVSEDGSKLLLNHVLEKLLQSEKEAMNEENRRKVALTPDNYKFTLEGTEAIDGHPQYVLGVEPRIRNKFLYRGKVWIDASDYAVSRISAEPAKNPSFWITHTDIQHRYTKVGNFWLPQHNTTISKIRFGGSAELKIDYFDYKIGNVVESAADSTCSKPPDATLSGE